MTSAAWQHVVEEGVDVRVGFQVAEAGGSDARKVSWKSGGGLIEDEQIGVGVCQEEESVGRYREGGWRAVVVVDRKTIRSVLPAERGEVQLRERRRRW